MHPSNKVTQENVAEVVRYHRPVGDQAVRHERLSAATEAFIRAILSECPDCADRSAAIRLAREAKMTGSAAIALEERPERSAADAIRAAIEVPAPTLATIDVGGPILHERNRGSGDGAPVIAWLLELKSNVVHGRLPSGLEITCLPTSDYAVKFGTAEEANAYRAGRSDLALYKVVEHQWG